MRFAPYRCVQNIAVDKERLFAIHVVNDGTKSFLTIKNHFFKKLKV
jgi:hypothetical protein